MCIRYLLNPPESLPVSEQIYSLELAHWGVSSLEGSAKWLVWIESLTTVWLSEHGESLSREKSYQSGPN